MKKYNIAVVGATGLVGKKMIEVLEEHNLPINTLLPLASSKSAGKKIFFSGKEIKIEELKESSFDIIDIALFSAGGDISRIYAPIAARSGCIVIDNSSAFRMDDDVPLVVPEVNAEALKNHKGIIANPNCSTIQLMLPVKVLMDNYGIDRLICSTYQSITGAGQKGLDKLNKEIDMGIGAEFNDNQEPIAYNTLFHEMTDNGFTDEENKMINETRKILKDENMKLAYTCVRIPTIGGHAESVNIDLSKSYEIDDIKKLFLNTDGLVYIDEITSNSYPTPNNVNDKDTVFVSRLRRDDSTNNGLYMWVVADNLRKGAATNAVQIAEKLIEMELLD